MKGGVGRGGEEGERGGGKKREGEEEIEWKKGHRRNH